MIRTLRRIAAAVLLCAVLTCSAAAATYRLPFSDTYASENSNEIITMYDLGLLRGYADGTFRPDATITRAEVCKLVMQICTDAVPAASSTPFTDVAADNWAAPYIRWCADNGIVSGSGGCFRPAEPVTGFELAKMLLVAIRAGTSYAGGNWQAAVERDANAYGLFKGFYGNATEPLTRKNACTLVYNALHCNAVKAVNADGSKVYETDDLLNPITILEARFGVVRYTELVEANEFADLTRAGGRLEGGYTKLAQHRAFPVFTDLRYLGRTADIYVQDGKVIGLPCLNVDEVCSTTTAASFPHILAAALYTTGPTTSWFLNYDAVPALDMTTLSPDAEVTVVDHENDGVIDLVMAVDWQRATVESLDAQLLTLTLPDGETIETDQFVITRSFSPGDTVRYAWIGGMLYI